MGDQYTPSKLSTSNKAQKQSEINITATNDQLTPNSHDNKTNVKNLRRRELGRKLIAACELGDTQQVEQLLRMEECDPNIVDSTTPLISAIKRADLQLVQILVSEKRINVNMCDEIGQTPLIVSAKLTAQQDNPMNSNTNLIIAKLLLHSPNIIVDAQDSAGTTALLYASILGNFQLTKLLVQAKADPNRWNNIENTPLHYAAIANHPEMVSFLLQNGALSDENLDGKTPLDLAEDYTVKELLRGKHTSETHPLQVDFIDSAICPLLGKAAVGMSMCPGRQNHKNWSRDITKDMKVIKEHNTEVIITLMTNEELTRMDMKDLCKIYSSNGLMTIHYGITDKWLPSSVDEFVSIVEKTVDLIKQGKKILIHCNGGKGRTGLLLVGSLIKLGMTQFSATETIRKVRPGMLYNPAQQAYLLALTAKLQNQGGLLDKAKEWLTGDRKTIELDTDSNEIISSTSSTEKLKTKKDRPKVTVTTVLSPMYSNESTTLVFKTKLPKKKSKTSINAVNSLGEPSQNKINKSPSTPDIVEPELSDEDNIHI